MRKLIIEVELNDDCEEFLGMSDIEGLQFRVEMALQEIAPWDCYFKKETLKVEINKKEE